MRWKAVEPPKPKDGDKRELKKFAWNKVRIGDHWVWLEFYIQEQIYVKGIPTLDDFPGYWEDGERRECVWYL